MILRDSGTNGYKRTQKGYYIFKHIDRRIFYRSSWERAVLETLDDLIELNFVIDVDVPRRIEYHYDFVRHYYPDIQYTLTNGKTIIAEIKPKMHLSRPMNVAKIDTARKIIENFIILTEDDIFSDNLNQILLGEIYDAD